MLSQFNLFLSENREKSNVANFQCYKKKNLRFHNLKAANVQFSTSNDKLTNQFSTDVHVSILHVPFIRDSMSKLQMLQHYSRMHYTVPNKVGTDCTLYSFN